MYHKINTKYKEQTTHQHTTTNNDTTEAIPNNK